MKGEEGREGASGGGRGCLLYYWQLNPLSQNTGIVNGFIFCKEFNI